MVGEYSKSWSAQKWYWSCKLGSGGTDQQINSLHSCNPNFYMASQGVSRIFKNKCWKKGNVVMIISKLSFHLLRIKPFYVLSVLFLEKSFQRAVWKLPSPNLGTAHKNYKNIPIFFRKRITSFRLWKHIWCYNYS